MKNIKIFIFIFVLSFLYNLVPGVIFAQSSETEIKSQIENNNKEIQKLEQEIADYNLRIKDKKENATTLKSAINALEARKSILEKDITLSGYKIKNTKSTIAETEVKITKTATKLSNLKLGMENTFREMQYISKLKESQTFIFLSGESVGDIFDKYNRSYTLKKNISDNVAYFATTKKTLEVANADYKDNVKTLEDQQEALNEKKLLVAQSQKEKDTLLKETKSQEASYQKILAQTKKQKADLEKEILDFESKLKALADPSKLPKSGSGVLAYPVKNIKITQTFGNTPFSTQNPQVYNGSGHNGVDFAVPIGTGIYSSGDGVVSGTGDTDATCKGASYGRWVLVKHPNGLSTLYAHLSVISVSEGQSVTSGQKLALSGNTGYSTGPHLHFTVYASDAVKVSGPTEYKSKSCGTYMKLPIAPRNAYLNPLTYL